ncbi:MAG: hypothetical protein R2792_05245 [Saprospiraceae bacterium]|jgi:hypothetical protein
MLLKWIFTFIALLWLIRMFNLTFRPIPPESKRQTQRERPARPEGEMHLEKRRPDKEQDGDYIDYEEVP